MALIASDSVKSWKLAQRFNGKIRMNMGPCFMAYRQTFQIDSLVFDNNSKTINCGPSLKGKWQLHTTSKGNHFIKISSPQLPQLLNSDKEYKYFKILYLSRDTLKISFSHKQYGNQVRTITDYLVREDLDVGDRYFHH